MLMSNKLGPRWRFPTIKEGKQIPIKAFYFLIQELRKIFDLLVEATFTEVRKKGMNECNLYKE